MIMPSDPQSGKSKGEGYIRSFVRRTAHFNARARADKARLFASFGVTLSDAPLDLPALFQRNAPMVLEIGFGMGQSFMAQALAHPEQNFLGIEVHTPGVAKVLKAIEDEGLTNIRVIEADAVQVLSRHLLPESLDVIQLFFPDPWPKNRHHKRRIVNPHFLNEVHRVLKLKGRLHMATDWAPYANVMLKLLNEDKRFLNQSPTGDFATRGERILTKFEAQVIAAGSIHRS